MEEGTFLSVMNIKAVAWKHIESLYKWLLDSNKRDNIVVVQIAKHWEVEFWVQVLTLAYQHVDFEHIT